MVIEQGKNDADAMEAVRRENIKEQVDDLAQLMKDVIDAGPGGFLFINDCVSHMTETVRINIPEEERAVVDEIRDNRGVRVRTIQMWGV